MIDGDAMRALALALLFAAGPASAAAPAPHYQIMEVLKPFCIDTKAEPSAVRAAALAAGYKPSPSEKTQVDLVSKRGSIALLAGVGHLPADEEGGPREVDTCMIFLWPAKNQEATLFAWLGIKRPYPALPWSYYFVDEPSGPRVLSQKDRQGRVSALAAGTLRMIKFEPTVPEGEHVIYGVVRPAPSP